MKARLKIFKSYNRKEILDSFSRLSVDRKDNRIYTKYDGRLISSTDVSNRYEVFDISSYINDILPNLEKNFKIDSYYVTFRGGIQMLELVSEQIDINGMVFHKSFFIINSTNKTRALSFNLGLKATGFFMVGSNLNLYKKHYKGITEESDNITGDVDVESFDDQIDSVKKLFNNKVLFSNVRKVILGEDMDIPKVSHMKFDAFKNAIRYNNNNYTNKQIELLNTKSEKLDSIDRSDDFYLDAFDVFRIYLSIFRNQDAYVVKKETKKILDITQWGIRKNQLEKLGI